MFSVDQHHRPMFPTSSPMGENLQYPFPQMLPPPPPPPPQPFLTHLNNSNSSPNGSSNLDSLNLSRTIILKHISNEVTLTQLFDNIEFGPIEYCKMFSKPTPRYFLEQDPSLPPTLKSCYISFINSNISILFHLKYFKNPTNLNHLKEKLSNSKYLKIQLNENSNNLPQDFIKMKTLNYIVEYNATRSLIFKFSISSDVQESQEAVVSSINSAIYTQCLKFGDIEQFKMSLPFDNVSEDNRINGKALIHFTSIDSAIKTYEHYLKRIEYYERNSEESLGSIRPFKGEGPVTIKYNVMFLSVQFHKDRCDQTPIHKQRPKKSKSRSFRETESNETVDETYNNDITGLVNDVESIKLSEDDEITSMYDSTVDKSINLDLDVSRTHFLVESISSNESILDPPSPSTSTHTASSSSQDFVNMSSTPLRNRARVSNQYATSSPMHTPNGFSHQMPIQQMSSHGHGPQSYMVHTPTFPTLQTPHGQSVPTMGNYQISHDPFNVGNRTIYLGNFHPNTTIEEIANNVRAGGLVESINFHREKRVCFITFIDPGVALKFYLNHQVLHQLIIHGHDISVGWAKNHSGPLNREISLAVTAGASRNVYLGIKLFKDAPPDATLPPKPTMPSEKQLRKDFSIFGSMEQINFYHNKDCCFLNFLYIYDAIKLVQIFEMDPGSAVQKLAKLIEKTNSEDSLGAARMFYDKYSVFKVSFAKDRCGNPPKFSFRKKSPHLLGSTYQQYQHLLHENLEKRGRYKEKRPDQKAHEDHESFMEDTINEEAAMVFGIISNSNNKEKKPDDENTEISDAEDDNDLVSSMATIESDGVVLDNEVENESPVLQDHNVENKEETEDPEEVVQNNDDGDDNDGDDDEADDDDDDDDDDDEVSIIICGDEAGAVPPQTKKHQKHKSRKLTPRHRVYHNAYNHSEPTLMSSRNSSTFSVAPRSQHQNHHAPSVHQAYKFSGSPFIQQQPAYFASPQMPRHNGYSRPAYVSHPSYTYGTTHAAGYYPPQHYASQQYAPQYAPQQYAPQQYAPQQYAPQQYFSQPQYPNQMKSSSYSSSGSEVMAQYLAKSQKDSMMYATGLADDEDEVLSDYQHRYSRRNSTASSNGGGFDHSTRKTMR